MSSDAIKALSEDELKGELSSRGIDNIARPGSRDISQLTGINFDSLGLVWQYRWGAGL